MNNQLSLSGTRLRVGDLLPLGPGNAAVAAGDANTAMALRLLHEALLLARRVASRSEAEYCMALRMPSPVLAAAALEHANGARVQADALGARILALGGTPAASTVAEVPLLSPDPRDTHSLVAVIGCHLVAAHASIESYRQIATLMEPCDRATQMLLEGIVSGEEQRASQLAALLEQASARRARNA